MPRRECDAGTRGVRKRRRRTGRKRAKRDPSSHFATLPPGRPLPLSRRSRTSSDDASHRIIIAIAPPTQTTAARCQLTTAKTAGDSPAMRGGARGVRQEGQLGKPKCHVKPQKENEEGEDPEEGTASLAKTTHRIPHQTRRPRCTYCSHATGVVQQELAELLMPGDPYPRNAHRTAVKDRT